MTWLKMMKLRRMTLVCGSLGLCCWVAFELMGVQVDADGYLHEFFALEAVGKLLLLGAVLTEVANWLWELWRRFKKRH